LVAGSAEEIERTMPDLARQMRTRCRDFCGGALKRHHGGEDMTLFPALAHQFPALAPAVAQLGGEREAVARAQQAIRELVDGFVPGESDPRRPREERERPAHRLESHFTYEEETDRHRARRDGAGSLRRLTESPGWHVSDPTYPQVKRNFAIREIVRA